MSQPHIPLDCCLFSPALTTIKIVESISQIRRNTEEPRIMRMIEIIEKIVESQEKYCFIILKIMGNSKLIFLYPPPLLKPPPPKDLMIEELVDADLFMLLPPPPLVHELPPLLPPQ